jgi:hypothetical protein
MRHTVAAWRGRPRSVLFLPLVVALAVLALAAPAMAGPPEPTISVADLQTKLASGPLDGYFLTVVGGTSQDPVQIPVTVLSVVPDLSVDGALILFEASGPVIDKVGGVAFGMSGSPVYVDDGGTFKLIGAVAYGPEGASALGMATPIEYMAAMEDDFPAKTVTLALPEPVAAGGGLVSKVTVAASGRVARRLQPRPGVMVMSPLAALTIGGLQASSPAFKKAATRLAKQGLDVHPGLAVAGGGAFSTPFVPGSTLAAMLVTGDGWTGGFGTTTYVDGDVVVGFGHPLDGGGSAGYDIANGYVGGVWSGLFGPEKIVAPGAVAGTITQDRTAGIAGRLDLAPPQVPVTSTVTFNGKTIVSHSAMPQWVIDSPGWSWLADFGPWTGMMMATHQGYLVGSATTSTEVKLSDGTTDYDVKLDNAWDDTFDVISWATGDLDAVLYALTSNSDGIAPATITSVDFTADLSTAHDGTRILDVSVPGGLKTGLNTVRTTILEYGDPVPKVLTTDLTIPKGMSRSGYLEVYGGGDGGGEWGDFASIDLGGVSSGPQTVADIVAGLQARPKNSDLQVVYTPSRPLVLPPPAIYPIVDLSASTATVSPLTGDVTKQTGAIHLTAPYAVRRGSSARVRGVIESVVGNTTVRIYRRVVGQTAGTFVRTVQAVMDEDYAAHFSFRTGALRKNTRFTAVWGGDEQSLGATASRLVRVRVAR